MLPCAYYLLTFTLPDQLRPLARSHQKTVYALLMKSAAAALLTLARDVRYVGGRLGCLAVLHTWTRDLRYHPHVHLLVTAGGLSADGTAWIAPTHSHYLVPVQALSRIFRAKMCAALNHAGLLDQVPRQIWPTPWVVHCQHAGRGQTVLDYLGRYLFRVAIANSRLERIQDGQVTFRYRDNRPQHVRRVTLSGVAFLQRFLQHVLPRGCTKVRYYGIWSPTCRRQLDQARAILTSPRLAPTAPHAHAATGPCRSFADALSPVSNRSLDPRGHPRSATATCARTPSWPDVARSSTPALGAWQRRRLPRRRIARGSGACRSSVAFTQATPPIVACTFRSPHGSRRAALRHAHAR